MPSCSSYASTRECFAKVYRTHFWTAHYESATARTQVAGAIRHLWFYWMPDIQFANETCDQPDSSERRKAKNKTHVAILEAGRLTHGLCSRLVIKTAKKYLDKPGRKGCVGTTQWVPERCQLSIVV